MENQNLNSKLKGKNMSFTQQRRVVLEELEKQDDHLTADQVYMLVKKRMPKVSIGTIYRNLTTLVEIGLIDKLSTSLHGESFYEPHKENHYHIVCTKCLRIDDLEHYRALSIEPTASKITGYEVTDHLIELHGLCPKCKTQGLPTVQPESTKDLNASTQYTQTPSRNIPEKPKQQIFDRSQRIQTTPNRSEHNTTSQTPNSKQQPNRVFNQEKPRASDSFMHPSIANASSNNRPPEQRTSEQNSNNSNANSNPYNKKHNKKKFFFGKRGGF